jgi:hypothetical protein
MDKIIELEIENKIVEYIIIDHGNEQFTSMPKSEYDKQQAEQSTPIVKPSGD